MINLEGFYKDLSVLVTGGTGFIGSNLVAELIEKGAHVRCLVHAGSNAWRLRDLADNIEWIKGDLTSDSDQFWADICKDINLVFHLGAGGVQYRPDLCWKDLVKTNVMGTAALIYGAAAANVKRIIVTGSCVEYGQVDSNETITEKTPLNPTNIYAATKSASTLISKVCLQENNIEGLILRLFYVYGMGELPPKLIPTLINSALNKQVAEITEGSQTRDFCYVEDVVDAFLHAGLVELPNNSSMILNVGSGREASIAQVADLVMQLIPENGGLKIGAIPCRRGEVRRLVPEIDKTQNILNWEARWSLEEGLSKTIDWFRTNSLAGKEVFDPFAKNSRYCAE